MSERRDPPRLKDEPQAEWPVGFREALAGYASAVPSVETRGRVIERVESRLASQAGGGSWKPTWLTSGIVVVVGVAGWFAYEHLNARDLGLDDTSAQHSPLPAPAPHPRVRSMPPLIEDVPPGGPVKLSAPSVSSESSASVRATLRRRVERVPGKSAHPVETVAPPVVTPATSDPRAELALLIRARSILSSEPAQALALVKEHGARFPQSAFEEEREVLAIDAERRLGQTQAAAERARLFLKAHPRSIHRPSVEASARER